MQAKFLTKSSYCRYSMLKEANDNARALASDIQQLRKEVKGAAMDMDRWTADSKVEVITRCLVAFNDSIV